MTNKQKSIERFLKTNRVHIAVITETHLLEGEIDPMVIKDYKIIRSCFRKRGEEKVGVAILLHTTIPYVHAEHRTAGAKS